MKFLLLFSLLLCLASATIIHAQTGTIDKTYGTGDSGTVLIAKQTYLHTVAIQWNNDLLVGGEDTGDQFSIMRLDQNGAVDASFGENGQANTSFDDIVPNLVGIIGWQGLAVQKDGKIVATGTVGKFSDTALGDYPNEKDIVLARYLPDGKPDESFGEGGRLVTNLGKQESARAIAIQQDGKIVVAGYQAASSDGGADGVLVLRYNPDGSLDKTFGNGGFVTYEKRTSAALAVLLQPDGKIVTGGYADVDAFFMLVRFLPDGSVDASFGDDGQVVTSFTKAAGVDIYSIALDESGRIAAAGKAGALMAVARYLPDGQLDNSFDTDGKKLLSFDGATNGVANTVLSQPNGKLVVIGDIAGGTFSHWTLALTGLNEDGSADSSFAGTGTEITNLGFTESISTHAAVQSDGKIVVAGNFYTDNSNNTGFSSTRFIGYPVHVSLAVRIKRYLQNHIISWQGLPADDNTAYYTVEQSANNKTGFKQVTKLSGRGNLKEYSTTNSSLLEGRNYYRVKAVSADGTIRYSEVVSADNTANTASVYPNPAKEYVTVQGLPTTETANISISDGSGNVKSKGVSNGAQYRSSLNNLQPGTYYVNITTGAKTETLKFVKE